MSDEPLRVRHSLRRRLMALVLASVAVASMLQAAHAYRSALRTADALFDAQLQTLARAAQAGSAFEPGDPAFSVQIWGPGGVLLYSAGAHLPRTPRIGFSEVVADGETLRVYTVATPQRTVQIAQNLTQRRTQARALAIDAVLPVIGLGLLLMAAAWAVIDRTLKPVERVRRTLAGRSADDLSPVPDAGLPAEVSPLVHEFNQLLGRVEQTLRGQQRFVADAAHELRSPLTALRLQVQALRRQPPGAPRDAAVADLEAGINRAAALVGQLLALAREESAPTGPIEPVDLQALVRDVVGDLLPLARARRVDVGLVGDDGIFEVDTEREPLRTLLRNLVENAVKYTPPGGQVDIGVERHEAALDVLIEDSGPGIPEDERTRVFERFHRVPDAGTTPGSGLGLAIVAAVAARLGLGLTLDEAPSLGGLRVRVRFPAGAAPRKMRSP